MTKEWNDCRILQLQNDVAIEHSNCVITLMHVINTVEFFNYGTLYDTIVERHYSCGSVSLQIISSNFKVSVAA